LRWPNWASGFCRRSSWAIANLLYLFRFHHQFYHFTNAANCSTKRTSAAEIGMNNATMAKSAHRNSRQVAPFLPHALLVSATGLTVFS
jgi:hypothetical protein